MTVIFDTVGDSLSSFPFTREVVPQPMGCGSSLLVQGLSLKITSKAVQKYFSRFGEVVGCALIENAEGHLIGAALVTFSSWACAALCVSQQHVLGRRELQVWPAPADFHEELVLPPPTTMPPPPPPAVVPAPVASLPGPPGLFVAAGPGGPFPADGAAAGGEALPCFPPGVWMADGGGKVPPQKQKQRQQQEQQQEQLKEIGSGSSQAWCTPAQRTSANLLCDLSLFLDGDRPPAVWQGARALPAPLGHGLQQQHDVAEVNLFTSVQYPLLGGVPGGLGSAAFDMDRFFVDPYRKTSSSSSDRTMAETQFTSSLIAPPPGLAEPASLFSSFGVLSAQELGRS